MSWGVAGQKDRHKESPPAAAEPAPVSKEQSRRNKEESGHAVQEEEKQPKPDTEKCSLTGDSNKPTRGNSLVSAKKRKQ